MAEWLAVPPMRGNTNTILTGTLIAVLFLLTYPAPLLSQGDATKSALNQAFMRAAGHHDVALVKALLAQGANPNVKGPNGIRPIFLFAWQGDAATMQLLQKAGADINATDGNGNTALMGAAQCGWTKAVRAILKQGAKVNLADPSGDTALMGASMGGWDTITQLLLEYRAKVNAQNHYGQTALFLAVAQSSNSSPLNHKFYMQRVKVVRLLLNKSADVNIAPRDGWSALMAAARYGNVEMVEDLLKNGADVKARDSKGRTVLQIAKQGKKPEEIIRLLKQAGIRE